MKQSQMPLNTFAHYSDPAFSSGNTKTIYGRSRKGLHYDYSDRLYQFDHKKARAAESRADDAGPKNSAAWYEAMLSHFYGYPVELIHVVKGVNVSNGYGYLVFGSKRKQDE